MPALPAIRLDDFDPVVRHRMAQALSRSEANPEDAAASGELGMLLHVYEQFQSAAACYRRAEARDSRSARWPYYLGVVLAEQGRHREAVGRFQEALRRRPDAMPARLRLAASLLALNRLEESRKLYEQLTGASSESAAAHYGLGRVLFAQGKAAEAVAAYRRVCELAPQAGAAHYALALAYRATGEDDMASRHLALFHKHRQEKIPEDDAFLEAIRGLRADKHWYLSEGRRLEASGKVREARDAYAKVLEIDPNYVPAHVNLIGAYGVLGDLEKAEEHYRHALRLKRDSEELHINWGIIRILQNRPTEAAGAFREALRVNPNSADAHQNLGYALDQSGRTGEAIHHYREALRHDPRHRVAHFHLGRHYVLRGDVEAGLKHLLETVESVDQRTPRYLYAIADAYRRIDRREKAVDYARRARRLAQDLGQAHLAAAIEKELVSLVGGIE